MSPMTLFVFLLSFWYHPPKDLPARPTIPEQIYTLPVRGMGFRLRMWSAWPQIHRRPCCAAQPLSEEEFANPTEWTNRRNDYHLRVNVRTMPLVFPH